MVLRGRSLYISDFPSRRAASVPVAPIHLHRVEDFTDDWEPDAGAHIYSRASHVFQDADDIVSSSKRHDIDFLRDVGNKVYFSSVHPPAPIVLDSYGGPVGHHTTTYSSVPYTAYGHTSRPRAPLHYDYRTATHAHPTYHHPSSYSTDSKRRTWATGLRPVIRRHTAMDDEVEAFLASTPHSRYPAYVPSFRSRSTPAVSHYNTSYSHAGTPSYTTQHLYRPLATWTPATTNATTGWQASDTYHGAHQGYQPSYSLSTRITSPVPSPPIVHEPFVTSIYRPLNNYVPSSGMRYSSVAVGRPRSVAIGPSASYHKPISHGTHLAISSDLSYSPKPPIPSLSSSHKIHSEDYHSPSTTQGRSRSGASQDFHASETARKPRSLSADAPRPIVNYRDVKPPMSDTRRKARDLICKARKDPHYYD